MSTGPENEERWVKSLLACDYSGRGVVASSKTQASLPNVTSEWDHSEFFQKQMFPVLEAPD